MDGQNNVDPHISGTNNGELHSAIKYEGDGNGGIGPLPGGAEGKIAYAKLSSDDAYSDF